MPFPIQFFRPLCLPLPLILGFTNEEKQRTGQLIEEKEEEQKYLTEGRTTKMEE
jgi:hypothetical protein